MSVGARSERVSHAVRAVRALAEAGDLDGVVLTGPGPVAWATGGMNPPVDRTASTDVVWLCVAADRLVLLTTEVEAPRILAELDPQALGMELVALPWWDAEAFVRAAHDVLGGAAPATSPDAAVGRVGADGHRGFPVDVSDRLTAARLSLCPAEHDVLRRLGRLAATSVERALREWVPGETDFAVQGRISGLVEAGGADCPVLLVGADERLARFRHPVASGARAQRTVMAVLVARMSGVHVALTRYAHAGPVDAGLLDGLAATRRIHRRILGACVPGASYGSVLEVLAQAYTAEGHPGAWRQHYQGGPIGFAQREFEIAPVQRESVWWDQPVAAGSAVAWNPSLPGGAKDEDTYLIGPDGTVELVTRGTDWPSADEERPDRPDVLLVGV